MDPPTGLEGAVQSWEQRRGQPAGRAVGSEGGRELGRGHLRVGGVRPWRGKEGGVAGPDLPPGDPGTGKPVRTQSTLRPALLSSTMTARHNLPGLGPGGRETRRTPAPVLRSLVRPSVCPSICLSARQSGGMYAHTAVWCSLPRGPPVLAAPPRPVNGGQPEALWVFNRPAQEDAEPHACPEARPAPLRAPVAAPVRGTLRCSTSPPAAPSRHPAARGRLRN